MKIEGWEADRIAAEARALLGNPVLATLLASMETGATGKIVAAATGDEQALRSAACELKAVRNVRSRLVELARKEQTNVGGTE